MKIAFISDIHSNLEAFQAVLDKIDSLDIKEIYSIGDIVGYAADPAACIDLMNERKIASTLGNHDYATATGDTTWFNPLAAEAIEWGRKRLHEDGLKFLSKLPKSMTARKALLVHGSPRDPVWEYVYADDVDESFVINLDYDVIVMGHTHVPFVKAVGDKLVINCGAVGQPRDGINKASFVVFDTEGFDARIIRVEYDIKAAAEKIIKAGLPAFLAQRLFSGI